MNTQGTDVKIYNKICGSKKPTEKLNWPNWPGALRTPWPCSIILLSKEKNRFYGWMPNFNGPYTDQTQGLIWSSAQILIPGRTSRSLASSLSGINPFQLFELSITDLRVLISGQNTRIGAQSGLTDLFRLFCFAVLTGTFLSCTFLWLLSQISLYCVSQVFPQTVNWHTNMFTQECASLLSLEVTFVYQMQNFNHLNTGRIISFAHFLDGPQIRSVGWNPLATFRH